MGSGGDPAVEALIRPYREILSAEMDEIVALAARPLEKGSVESTLGNWVADAVLAQAKMITKDRYAFAICNSGGLRIPGIPAGPVRKGILYELMPFDNYLVTMQLPGKVIRQLFDRMAESGGWPISEGVSYVIKNKKAENILIDGVNLDDEKSYKIVLSDYLAEGGSDCDFLTPYDFTNLEIYYRDALIEYAAMQHAISKSLDAQIEGRVISKD